MRRWHSHQDSELGKDPSMLGRNIVSCSKVGKALPCFAESQGGGVVGEVKGLGEVGKIDRDSYVIARMWILFEVQCHELEGFGWRGNMT